MLDKDLWIDLSCFLVGSDDYRLFCGDLGNEVNDDVLSKAFTRFPSFNMARVSGFSHLAEILQCFVMIGLVLAFSISSSDFCLKGQSC